MRYSVDKVDRLLGHMKESLGKGWKTKIEGYHSGGYLCHKDGIEVIELRAKFMGHLGYRAEAAGFDIEAEGKTPKGAVKALIKLMGKTHQKQSKFLDRWVKAEDLN
jgi:hypothetical protein